MVVRTSARQIQEAILSQGNHLRIGAIVARRECYGTMHNAETSRTGTPRVLPNSTPDLPDQRSRSGHVVVALEVRTVPRSKR